MFREELWKPVLGYEREYQISNFGQVLSLGRYVGTKAGGERYVFAHLLKIQLYKTGYLYVNLHKNNIGKKHKVHRLVAIHFVDNSNNLPEVNHEDGDKRNCRHTNLKWCTKAYNERHAHKIGLKNHKGEHHPNRSLTDSLVLEIRRLVKEGTVSQRGIALKYNLNYKTVNKIVLRQRWNHI